MIGEHVAMKVVVKNSRGHKLELDTDYMHVDLYMEALRRGLLELHEEGKIEVATETKLEAKLCKVRS